MSYNTKANSLHEISLVSAAIGCCIGVCTYTMCSWSPFSIYVIVLCLFHYNEFVSTAQFNPGRVNSRSFLVYGNGGSREYWYVQLMTTWEFVLMSSRVVGPSWQRTSPTVPTVCVGTVLALAGVYARRLAMRDCGESFSHYIETESDRKTLVTSGVYRYSRHPSYVGFWLVVVGVQVLLCNWISLIVCVVVMNVFFKRRIRFEEWFLVRSYGDDYTAYQGRVGIWLPLI